eukprot:COSAG01_NODE_61966_length_287_cov_0.425532_1_plen_53_part_01
MARAWGGGIRRASRGGRECRNVEISAAAESSKWTMVYTIDAANDSGLDGLVNF